MKRCSRDGIGIRIAAALVALAGALALAAPASAATIEVPGDFSTIQAAVDSADPGDVVEVSKKENVEQVDVPVENLTIMGIGKNVIVDGFGATEDHQFDALASGLKVQNLELRHGSGIDCDSFDGCTVNKVRFTGTSDTSCIRASGAENVKVTNSSLRSCDHYALTLFNANGAKVTGNDVTRIDSGCIQVHGADAIVKNNVLRKCEDGDAIEVVGSNALVQKNTVEGVAAGDMIEVAGSGARVVGNTGGFAGEDCFSVDGNDALITDNTGTVCGDDGIAASGQNPIVADNAISWSTRDGISVACSVACEEAEVARNSVRDTVRNSRGMDLVFAAGTGSALIEENQVRDSSDDGIGLFAHGAVVRANVVRNSSNEGEEGIEVSGDGNTLTANKATGGSGDGISLFSGESNTLKRNVASGNDGDGIYLSGLQTGSTLISNTAKANFADGIENDGTDTNLQKNEASGNRRDCANDGTIATNQQNQCADGSDFELPGTASP